MRIVITGKNMEPTESLENIIKKKAHRLDRYFEKDTDIMFVLSVEKNRHIMEATVPFGGIILRAESITNDMYSSVDDCLAKLEKQIIRHRTKLEKRLKADAFQYEAPLYSDEFDEPDDTEEAPHIVRTKRFAVKPMPVEEAMMQMELLGHNFYVFRDADDEEINVLYRRKDGNYGLIEAE